MPNRTKRITNPDGTVTVHKISDEDTKPEAVKPEDAKPEDAKPEDVKHEADWGDGPHLGCRAILASGVTVGEQNRTNQKPRRHHDRQADSIQKNIRRPQFFRLQR